MRTQKKRFAAKCLIHPIIPQNKWVGKKLAKFGSRLIILHFDLFVLSNKFPFLPPISWYSVWTLVTELLVFRRLPNVSVKNMGKA